MRLTAVLAGVVSCAIFFAANPGHANAEDLNGFIEGQPNRITKDLTLLGLVEHYEIKQDQQSSDQKPDDDNRQVKSNSDEAEAKEEPSKKIVTHKVSKNETLTSIAKEYDTTWQRLFAKNESLEHPDSLDAGLTIVVPDDDEDLTERDVPQPVIDAVQPERSHSNSARVAQSAPAPAPRSGNSGNTYYHGYCTWYVKNRRPDLPNNLGNAITWASRAAAQGIPTGSTPRVGAVGQQGNHVVYVEAVNGNGTVTISEMNFKGWNVTSSRTVAASSFTYIY